MNVEVALQLILNGLVAGVLYSLIGVGFSLIYGTTKIFHFALAGTYVLIAYSLFTLVIIFGFPIFLAIFISILLAGVLGILTDLFLYQPLEAKNASSLVKLLSSLGLYIVIVNSIALIFGNEPKIIFRGQQTTYSLGPFSLTVPQIINFCVPLMLIVLVAVLFKFTKIGKIMRAMRDDSQLLEVSGYNLNKIRLAIFVLGSMMAGLAAILLTLDVGVDPSAGMPIFITGVVAAIIGGVSNFQGAFWGALTLGFLQSIFSLFLPASWRELVVFLALLTILFFRRNGLSAVQRRAEDLTAV